MFCQVFSIFCVLWGIFWFSDWISLGYFSFGMFWVFFHSGFVRTGFCTFLFWCILGGQGLLVLVCFYLGMFEEFFCSVVGEGWV